MNEMNPACDFGSVFVSLSHCKKEINVKIVEEMKVKDTLQIFHYSTPVAKQAVHGTFLSHPV